MRHCYHFIAAARSEITQQSSTAPPESTGQTPLLSFDPGNNAWSSFLDASQETPVSLQRERDACIENVYRWERASKGHIEEALILSSRKDTDEYILASMLRIQVAMTQVALGTAFSQNEMEYDDFTTEFNTITTFAESIHPALVARDRGSRFHFNIGIYRGYVKWGCGVDKRQSADEQ